MGSGKIILLLTPTLLVAAIICMAITAWKAQAILFPDFSRLRYGDARSDVLLNNWSEEFRANEGRAKVGQLWPVGSWTRVCLVPVYYYGVGSVTDEELIRYFGSQYEQRLDTIPNPFAIHYGLGFSFLEDDYLEAFIEIPAVKLASSKKWFWSPRIPNRVAFHRNGVEQTLGLNELWVTFKDDEYACLSRTNGFLEFKSSFQIYAGEDLINPP